MSDNRHLIALGDYRFSVGVAEYDMLRRWLNLSWAKTDMIAGRPNYQYGGISDEGLSINGAVFNYRQNISRFDSPIMQTGTDQVSQLREQALKGAPLRLTLDTGRTLGYWIIVAIVETQSHFIQTAPLKQAFDIQLRFYGERL